MKKHILIYFIASILFTACGKTSTPAPDGSTGNNNGNNGGTTAPILAISSFAPQSASAGATITITGTAFGTDVNAIAIKFGTSTAKKPETVTATQITVIVPSDAQTGRISVTINGSTVTGSSDFTVVKADGGNSGGTTTPTDWTITNHLQTYDDLTIDKDNNGKLDNISATRDAVNGQTAKVFNSTEGGNGVPKWVHASITAGIKVQKYACEFTFANNNANDATGADTSATATRPYLKVSFPDAANKKIENYYLFFRGKVGLTAGIEFTSVPTMDDLNAITNVVNQRRGTITP